ncbi:MAG TPA: tetratricopeptide repeat protein [Chroococcales cyanobacterium]
MFLNQCLLATLTLVLLVCANIASAADLCNEKSTNSMELFKHGQCKEAIKLEKAAVKNNPRSWLAHAMLSYFLWYDDATSAAFSEAQLAAKLSPDKEILQTNVGFMAMKSGDYRSAISAFKRAAKIAPDDYVPWLGLIQCHLTADDRDSALACLQEMLSQRNRPYDWFFQISEISLQLDEPKLAAEAAAIARDLADTADQKSGSAAQLLLAWLRDNQLGKAEALRDCVFNSCRSKNEELYLRSASVLLPVKDPLAGKKLLDSAIENLNARQHANVFFRLGVIFETKSRYAVYDRDRFDAWRDIAAAAYRQATTLGPDRSIYHLALAGTTDQPDKIAEELNQAQTLDKADPLAPFFLARLNCNREDTTKELSKAASDEASKINLTKVDFKINGLGCACKLGRIRAALKKSAAVAFIATFSKKPYRGTMLVDESIASGDELLSECAQAIVPVAVGPASATRKTQPQPKTAQAEQEVVSFEVESRQPCLSFEDAVRVAVASYSGESYRARYPDLQPLALKLPETSEPAKTSLR